MKLEDITEAVIQYHPKADLDVISEAYVYSSKAHRDQSRRCGAAYISHPLEVAFNLTRLKMDEQTIAAGLLHDTIEDTLATAEELQELFGQEIYHLVEGVTKISQIQFSSREESQAENYRKMILAMSEDIRVVLIKLADRAHNVKTLGSLNQDAQRRIARETLDIFAPIANRLGIGWMKDELENSAFMYLMPDEHEAIRAELASGQNLRGAYVEKVRALLEKEMTVSEVPGKVIGRSKHLYSIYKKMEQQKLDFKDLYDLNGVRVQTTSLKDCYAVLGLVHSLWKPIPGRFKDYIAMPKPNLYQSLHTAVIGPEGERVEIQIRTEAMHKVCEEGIAAHWQYKEEEKTNQPMDQQLTWVRHLLETQKDLQNPKEFLNSFKVDLFFSEVYVFTPKGDVIALQRGATPVDFSYAVHTDIGDHCSAAKVNGKIVSLRYRLKNGDQVEIKTSKIPQPNRDWLAFVKTSKARSKILNFINAREKERSLSLGTELLHKKLAEYEVDPSEILKGKVFDEALHASGFRNFENLLRSIGLGKVSTYHFIEKLLPKEKIEERRQKESNQIKLKEKTPGPTGAIHMKCFDDDVLLRLGKCCLPVPGDPIMGYITRGRGVTVHHVECAGLQSLGGESERLVEVDWGQSVRATVHPVRISIIADDKPGQLAEITQVLASCGINITLAHLRQGADQRAYFEFFIEIIDLEHLNRMFAEVIKVPGVIQVTRMKEYNTGNKGTGRQKLDNLGG